MTPKRGPTQGAGEKEKRVSAIHQRDTTQEKTHKNKHNFPKKRVILILTHLSFITSNQITSLLLFCLTVRSHFRFIGRTPTLHEEYGFGNASCENQLLRTGRPGTRLLQKFRSLFFARKGHVHLYAADTYCSASPPRRRRGGGFKQGGITGVCHWHPHPLNPSKIQNPLAKPIKHFALTGKVQREGSGF